MTRSEFGEVVLVDVELDAQVSQVGQRLLRSFGAALSRSGSDEFALSTARSRMVPVTGARITVLASCVS